MNYSVHIAKKSVSELLNMHPMILHRMCEIAHLPHLIPDADDVETSTILLLVR